MATLLLSKKERGVGGRCFEKQLSDRPEEQSPVAAESQGALRSGTRGRDYLRRSSEM